MNEIYRLSEYEFTGIEEEVRYLFEGTGTVNSPENCYEAARLLKIKLIQYSKLKKSARDIVSRKYEEGFSFFNESTGFQICYNDSLSEEKVRETIWYEIAHIQLDHFDGKNKKSQEQMQAECLYFLFCVICRIFISKVIKGAA